MSYETNPITNRLKIAKGWKNSHFPTQTLNYSREMLLWFKVYIFLKAYFSFQQIRLLACEIRVSEKNTKVLYLSVNKDRNEQKKNAKSKLKSKSFLYALKSPLTKVQTQDSRFLLYQDFKSLKKLSSWTVNSYQKKIFSKAWLTKNRNSSWVNTAFLIFQSRNKFKSRQQRYLKQKNLRRSKIFKEENASTYLKNKKNLISIVPQANVKQTFWINKQRQIFSLFAKTQKEVLFIQKILNALSTSQVNEKYVQLQSLLENLIAQYEKKKQILFKLKKIYNFSFHSNIKLQKQNKVSTTRFGSKISQKQTQVKLKLFWLNLKKELVALKKQSLFFQNKPHFFFIWKKKLWKSSRFCIPTNLKLRNTILSLYFFYGPKTKNLVQQLFSLNKKNSHWMKYMLKGFVLAQSGKDYNNTKSVKFISKKDQFYNLFDQGSKRVSNLKPNTKALFYHSRKFNFLMRTIWKEKPVHLTKTRIFTKNKKLFSWQTLRLVRFHQKTTLRKPFRGRFYLGSKTKKKKVKYRRLRRTLKKSIKRTSFKQKLKYRLPYRSEYKNQLKLFTNWRLKYLIQDFIQKYFAVRLYVKLIWPLAQFKNLKFYRIVFPKKRNSKAKRISFGTKIRTKQVWLRKRYLFISQVTNHMRLKTTHKGKKKQRIFLKRIKKMLDLLPSTSTKLTNIEKKKNQSKQTKYKKIQDSLVFPFKKKFLTYKIAPNTWISKSPKKNAYLSRKLKMLQVQGQKRLHWAAKARFMSDLVTTLTLFAKYLDPQPLAEALAKVVGSTKKHVSTLKLVETVLRTLNFKRGVGYRICLTGRANGAEKSNVLYLRKLNRNRPRQTFSKNVNFAMAQARATIGTFGIKVWVFY